MNERILPVPPRDTSRSPRLLAPVVASAIVLAVLVVAVVGLLGRPGYTSSAQVLVSGSGEGASDSALRRQVASYAELAQSLPLATRVDRQLGLAGSPADLSERIHADAVPGTLLLRVRVTAPTAASARRTATAVLQQLDRLAGVASRGRGNAVTSVRAVTGPSEPTARDARHVVRDALVVGIPVGLALGLVAALVLALRPRPLRDRDELDRAVEAPVLGELGRPGTEEPDDDADRLRRNVRYLGVDRDGPLLVVAGVDGRRSAVESAVRLARSIILAGDRVLLIDADLRSGDLAKRLGLGDDAGLSSVLLGDVGLDAAVQHTPDPALPVLTRGPVPPNPGELVASASMRRLLATARKQYRTVIVIAAPPTTAPDCARLAAAGDGALLVVDRGTTSRRGLRKAAGRVATAGGGLVGVVLVGAEPVAAHPIGARPHEPALPAGPTVGSDPESDAAPDPGSDTGSDTGSDVGSDVGSGLDPEVPTDEPVDGPETEDSRPSIFSDPVPWPDSEAEPVLESGPDLGLAETAAAAPDPVRTDPWAIRETPDHPDPFWVGPDPASDAMPDAMPGETVGPDADPAEEPRSPWLSREGEVWTPPEPPPAAAAEPAPASWAAPVPPPTGPDPLSRSDADAEIIEPKRNGPRTAGELAALAGVDPTDDQPSDHQPTGSSDTPEGNRPRSPHGSTDDLLGDDVPWPQPGDTQALAATPAEDPAATGLAEGAAPDATTGVSSADPLTDDYLPDGWDEAPPTFRRTTGSLLPAPAEPARAEDTDPTRGEVARENDPDADDPGDAVRAVDSPGSDVPGTDEPDRDAEPRTGSLLDEFLTDDDVRDDDAGEVPAARRRADRGSLWRPGRRTEGR